MNQAPQKRQVIVIMTDTQRTDMLGCYGNEDMHTPHLDGLAQQGIRFDRAYTCQPVCGPARSAMFTGVWPHENGSWGNSMPLGANVKTIGQRLQDNGIQTGYIGKWHLDGSDYFGLGVCPDGWDPAYWYDMRNYLEELSDEDRYRSRQVESSLDPELTADFTFAHRCSNRALDFLQQHANEDFLLVVSYDEPHHPFLCPAPFNTMYADYEFPRSPNVWDTLEGKPEHQQIWAAESPQPDRDAVRIHEPFFLGCNAFVDDEIGRVIGGIDAHTPDALVIYTADHGDMLQSHSLTSKGPAMYDEITRIPFIVRWPDQAPTAATSKQPVSHIDLVPTILDYLGQEQPNTVTGRSLLPQFGDPAVCVNDAVFMEFGRYEIDHDGFGGFQPIRAVFDGRYKLVINLLATDEFYDLEADPQEMNNLILAEETRTERDRLHDRLLGWMNETRDPFRGYYWERRPWRADARPATWRYTNMTRQREEVERYERRQLDYATGLVMEKAIREKE